MGPIVALSLSQSAGGIRNVVIAIALLFLNFYAVSRIITKAGYSAKWILVPLAPVVLWFISLLVLVLDARSLIIGGTTVSVPVSLANFQVLEVFDYLSVVVAWVFFMIFAFSSWPAAASTRAPRGSFTNQPTAFVPTGRMPAHAPAAPPVPQPPYAPPGSAGPAAMPGPPPPPDPPTEPPRSTIFCSWCGKERAVDAQAIHHCGSKERPVVFCMHCGTPFEAGASNCASCGTPTTQVSR